WRPQSTYIRRPPYWEGALAGKRALQGMRPLAVLGDNITTDHLSPSNAIMRSSAAGEYLDKMGLPEEDFNSYATHRGDHLTAQRATFANPRLQNEMVKENGEIKEGSLTRIEPEGKVTRMWEAIEIYMDRAQPLIIIAGADYGQGSSRDWAAKGTLLLGVKAVIAESYERIHRSNLVGMGVLPLQFKDGDSASSLGLDGNESFDISGMSNDMPPQSELTVTATKADGSQVVFSVDSRLDTEIDVEYYRNGGILHTVLRDRL
ncbi:MAG: Fe/S-dependent 2-methylisocitrate dehydratase AcnD, partial [Chloroflexi bacterium]|nr:Fe/S-dependent 2-methylisocitrate dehydratase AcnD [Chloroflexota bacterium]